MIKKLGLSKRGYYKFQWRSKGKYICMMKKVLFILNNLEGGGAERVFVNIANGFLQNNIQVEFLLGKKQGVYLSQLNTSIPVAEVGGTSFLKLMKFFPGYFKKNNYTHVFTASHYIGAAAIISKRITRIKTKVYQTHHYTLPGSRSVKRLKGDLVLKLIYYVTAPFADKIIAVSNGSLEWLRKFSHHKLPQGICIYNPVYDKSIYDLASEAVDFPININQKKILLSVGRLAEEKDPFTLIKAFEIFRKNNSNTVLLILGQGPLQHELLKYIAVNGLQNEVVLVGFEVNPYKWMAKCDALILSSKYEGFGNVLVEAMALGKTVVSTDCPSGPNEILRNGELGYLCPVENPAAMARTIEKAIESPLDQVLLRTAAQQYNSSNIIKEYIAIL